MRGDVRQIPQLLAFGIFPLHLQVQLAHRELKQILPNIGSLDPGVVEMMPVVVITLNWSLALVATLTVKSLSHSQFAGMASASAAFIA
jgi:hypothetical protein